MPGDWRTRRLSRVELEEGGANPDCATDRENAGGSSARARVQTLEVARREAWM
jgi:hypothetical protein